MASTWMTLVALFITVDATRLRQVIPSNEDTNWCHGFDHDILMADSTIYLEEQSLSPSKVGGGSRLLPNMTFHGIVQEDEYAYYQVCIARHNHEHIVHINLTSIVGDPNLYLSTENPLPCRGKAAWIAQQPGNDHVELPTYLPEFSRMTRHLPLYIGVFGYSYAEYNLTVSIQDLPQNSDIKARKEYYNMERQQLILQHRLLQDD